MSNKKIVFVTYGGGHVSMVIPVIKGLQKRTNLDIVVLGLTTAGSTLEKNHIAHIGFKDLLKEDNYYARNWGEELVNKGDLHPLISYEESVAYMGLSYVDLEISHGVNKAKEIYLNSGRQKFLPLNTIQKFLESERPDLVVTTNSPRAEQAAILKAGELHIPSICLVDLFILSDWEKGRLSQPNYANKICVISEFAKQNLISSGRNSDDIIVTGNSAFDKVVKYKNKRNGFRVDKGWKEKSKVILWASQIEPDKHPVTKRISNSKLPNDIERRLVDLVSKRSDWILVIRPHPSEKIKNKTQLKNVYYSSPLDELYALLSAIDLVVTMTSTVGLEALLFRKAVVTINLSVFSKDQFFSKMDISYNVDSLGDIEGTLEKLLHGENNSKKIPCAHIGSATNNIISVVDKYIK